ncbi:NUDIX hydrolase [Halomarina litorea]|uniref:NUDIX hydrolase n=1 Tax=Halomarina litorea TaxID=2961595 RepID=UPI0020C2C3AA|nr:NUDIX domain-containing protein [Halomarina sp. BCD28]
MAGDTYDRVTAHLASLRGAYSEFAVQQTSVSVSSADYDRLRRETECGVVEAGARVRDDSGRALAVRQDGLWCDPLGCVGPEETVEEAAHRVLREATGVECRIVDLLGVRIVAATDRADPDREALYRLSALFTAEYRTGDPREGCAWRTAPPGALPVDP